MKLLVTTRADENIKGYAEITHPILKKHVNAWGADFQILSEIPDYPCKINYGYDGLGKLHYRIVKFKELFEEYDRIIHLDSDMLINKNCPNLFDVVPEDHVGTLLEDKGSRQNARRATMKEAQDLFGNIGWNSGYPNTGTFVVSKMHKDIFEPINNRFWEGFGWDDVHLGYQIHKLGFKIFELPFTYNHTTMYSESWNNYANRFDSYIIHYAGSGVFEAGPTNKSEQIVLDAKRIYG